MVPRAKESDGDLAGFLASAYGLTPDDWQDDALEGWLGRRSNGRWASATCGLAVPRQNGKNAVIEMRELYGMVELGERILHTAHEVKTARKAFLRIASFFENPREYPELAALVPAEGGIRRTNGQEAVMLTNGGSIEFIARSRGSGRGFTVDVLVCDEAQDLTDEELAALLPTISAAPSRNPQVILTGTPPNPEKPVQGAVFARVRSDAIKGEDPRLCFHDFGVEDGPIEKIDLDDRDVWRAVNPALGIRLAVGEVERERSLMSDEKFAAERLGWWGDPNDGSGFPMSVWHELRESGDGPLPAIGQVVVSVDVTPDRAMSAVCVAGRRSDGLDQVEVVRHARGTSWVVEKLVAMKAEHGLEDSDIIVDPAGAAGGLLKPLQDAGVVEPRLISTRELGQACGSFWDSALEGRFRHPGAPELDRAIAGATKKDLADAWKWNRKDGTDISPLVAATLALYGVADKPVDDGFNIW